MILHDKSSLLWGKVEHVKLSNYYSNSLGKTIIIRKEAYPLAVRNKAFKVQPSNYSIVV